MMIRALLRKQLRELGAAFLRSSKTGKARSRASAVGYALLFAVLVVVLMLCFAGMALPLASVLLPAGLDWLYFASMGLTALLVSVLASAFTSYSGLFQSRDNELLLSLPIPPAVIFGVRGEHRLSGLPDLPAHGVGPGGGVLRPAGSPSAGRGAVQHPHGTGAGRSGLHSGGIAGLGCGAGQ